MKKLLSLFVMALCVGQHVSAMDIFDAIKAEDDFRVLELLREDKNNANVPGEDGKTPLLTAASSASHTDPIRKIIVELLHTRGIDPFATDKDGKTFLHLLIENDPDFITSIKKTELFIYFTLKVDMSLLANSKDNAGQTPIMLAQARGLNEWVMRLEGYVVMAEQDKQEALDNLMKALANLTDSLGAVATGLNK